MNNFKPGDLVICIDNSRYEYALNINQIYKVDKINSVFQDEVFLEDPNKFHNSFDVKRFIPAKFVETKLWKILNS